MECPPLRHEGGWVKKIIPERGLLLLSIVLLLLGTLYVAYLLLLLGRNLYTRRRRCVHVLEGHQFVLAK